MMVGTYIHTYIQRGINVVSTGHVIVVRDWGGIHRSGYLVRWKEKAILACVSQFNGVASCPESIVHLSCILSIEPSVTDHTQG